MMQEQIMNTLLLQTIETDYDKVGKYNQDAVNGFADEVLDAMIECVAPSPLLRILHEIPLARQTELYESVYHVLKPGGYFVNLGFLYDDVAERDEFRKLVRFKDRTAGLLDAMRNRHVLTRDEFYARLHQVGFVDVQCVRHIHYTIHSRIGIQAYYPVARWERMHAALQAQWAKAMTRRRNGRSHFHGDNGVLICPGEITLARRPL